MSSLFKKKFDLYIVKHFAVKWTIGEIRLITENLFSFGVDKKSLGIVRIQVSFAMLPRFGTVRWSA